MYTPKNLANLLAEKKEFVVKLSNVKCGEYCTCDVTESNWCFSGEGIQIKSKSSGLDFIAVWSESPFPLLSGLKEIVLFPLGESATKLHGWFTAAQRMAGRPLGIGPDFVNLEPHEWPAHEEAFEVTFGGDYCRTEEMLTLPEAISGYIREVESVFASMQPPYVCPVCHDASCDATTNRESPCTYIDEL